MAPPTPNGSRRWILVVDDDATVRSLLLDVLEQAGYATVGAEDGYVAEELIRDLFPDLIVLDLHMPRGSGWTLLENMRQHPHWRKIPIVIVSGFLDHEEPPESADLNVIARFPKPADLDGLLGKVRDALGA